MTRKEGMHITDAEGPDTVLCNGYNFGRNLRAAEIAAGAAPQLEKHLEVWSDGDRQQYRTSGSQAYLRFCWIRGFRAGYNSELKR
jgi:hypothetical protein